MVSGPRSCSITVLSSSYPSNDPGILCWLRTEWERGRLVGTSLPSFPDSFREDIGFDNSGDSGDSDDSGDSGDSDDFGDSGDSGDISVAGRRGGTVLAKPDKFLAGEEKKFLMSSSNPGNKNEDWNCVRKLNHITLKRYH